MSIGVRVWSQCGGGRKETLHDRAIQKEEVFGGLVAQHSRLMFRVAYGLLRNPHDAEDAVQEAFLKMYRGDAWKGMEDEKAFLARTVWRVALDRVRARGAPMEDIAEKQLVSGEATPEESAARGDERQLLRILIDGLPLELKEALVLSALEEMSSRQVGIVLGVPEGTVRTRVMRARIELKKRFESMKGVEDE